MRENKVIYGLIGYGGMGRWHTEILSNVPEIEIGGIYDIKEEKRIEAKEKGFSVYGSEEEMLSDPDIDVVLIATPNDCHKPIAIRAMCNLLEYLTQRDIQTKNSGVNVRYRGKHRFFKGFNEFIKEKTRRCDNDFEKIERHVFF